MPDQSGNSSVVAVAAGSSFSAVLTGNGSVYVSGWLCGVSEGEGRETEGGGTWRLLHDAEREGGVVNIGAGLHYLVALVDGTVGGARNRHLLLWGSHSPALVISGEKTPSPSQLELPSPLVDWDAGPMELCLLLE